MPSFVPGESFASSSFGADIFGVENQIVDGEGQHVLLPQPYTLQTYCD